MNKNMRNTRIPNWNSSPVHAYCLTDVDVEMNPLGIEIWYQTARHFLIPNGIEAIRPVPKKYWTRYTALVLPLGNQVTLLPGFSTHPLQTCPKPIKWVAVSCWLSTLPSVCWSKSFLLACCWTHWSHFVKIVCMWLSLSQQETYAHTQKNSEKQMDKHF